MKTVPQPGNDKSKNPPAPQPYPQGSWGPEAGIELPAAPGWRLPDSH